MKGCATLLVLLCAAVLPVPTTAADIYRCTDENGNVAYLQLPCPPEEDAEREVTPDADASQAEQAVNWMSAQPQPEAEQLTNPAPSSRLENESLDTCKKRYRDQIDAIDAELRSSWSADEAGNYKEQLRALTQQLRACE